MGGGGCPCRLTVCELLHMLISIFSIKVLYNLAILYLSVSIPGVDSMYLTMGDVPVCVSGVGGGLRNSPPPPDIQSTAVYRYACARIHLTAPDPPPPPN